MGGGTDMRAFRWVLDRGDTYMFDFPFISSSVSLVSVTVYIVLIVLHL